MRFSRRVAANLSENPLALALTRRRRDGLPLIDLTESNPTRAGFLYEEARILQALAQPESLSYLPDPKGLPAARGAVARYFAESRGTRVDPENILITASTSEAYSLLFKLLCDPGDAVLVPTPSYPLFGFLTALESVRTIEYPLRWDGEWHVDLPALETLMAGGERIRALMIVSPGNPTGAYIKRYEYMRAAALCADRNIALISDEVFADYPMEVAAAGRSARQNPDDAMPTAAGSGDGLTFTLSGLSKVCGLPQLKLGWCAITGPDALVEEATRRLELIADTYLSVSTPVQLALSTLLDTRHALQAQVRARCTKNFAALREARPHDASWDVLTSEGGWCAILRVPDACSEEELALQLLARGVLVQPGYFYDFPRGNHLVLSLLPREDEFARAIALVADVLRADAHTAPSLL